MKLHKSFLILFFATSTFIIFIIAVTKLYLGYIPFWYDPARDLLQGLANLQKPTLIGPPSGIPGIFYGPYWIWLLSFGELFSKDPRMVAFIVLTIPYFTFFLFIFYKFSKFFGFVVAFLLWLLFMITFNGYSIQIWNPNLAPIFCLVTIYLLITNYFYKKSWKYFKRIFFAGLFGGLLMNFHIAFGLGVIVGSYLFLLFYPGRIKNILFFTAGILLAFLPFFLFEIRHGFNQIHTIISTLASSSAVVRETSFDKMQIIRLFFDRFVTLLHIPSLVAYVIGGFLISYTFFCYKNKKIGFDEFEKKLLLLVGTISFATLGIYLTSKNPVWDYHFIGIEILFLLLIGLLSKKNIFVKYILLVGVGVLLIVHIFTFTQELSNDPYKISSLTTKEHIVRIIYDDANHKSFSVFIFNPTQFTPDFNYLLMIEGEKRNVTNIKPENKGEYTYLIIPWTTSDLRADFIDNRTPNENFKTIKTWHIADETLILKRVPYEKK